MVKKRTKRGSLARKNSASALPFTANAEANELIARNGTAFLIAMCLEQQVRSEKAMIGPYELQLRVGHLDARKIGALPPARLDAVFRRVPALHRFPGMMAKRVRELCGVIARDYGNDGANVWAGVKDTRELYERFKTLPGFGQGKAGCSVRILGKYAKLRLPGWQRYASDEDLPWEFKSGQKVKLAPAARP